MKFSFIIPVYDRPDELRELLETFLRQQTGNQDISYEIIVVDDGSPRSLEDVANAFADSLPVRYVRQENAGPGAARNTGMRHARGRWFVILDSDILLPDDYLRRLTELEKKGALAPVGGGPDRARRDFPSFVRAVDLAMTSFITTGGIRGSRKKVSRYVPRSFNMIVRRDVRDTVGGFGNMHPGEDPEWVYRARDAGFSAAFYPSLYVYHKRRTSPRAFWKQMKKFGMTRVLLNRRYPRYASLVYYFPLFYMAGLILAAILWAAGIPWLAFLYGLYWTAIVGVFWVRSRNLKIALQGWVAFHIQMAAYAAGMLQAWTKTVFSRKKAEDLFPDLFFKTHKKA